MIQELKQEELQNYPAMMRTDADENAVERVLFVEEHPFMELEWSDYQFRIYEIRMKTDLT